MTKLPFPTESAEEVFRICVSSYRDDKLRENLMLVSPEIKRASEEYEDSARKGEISKIPVQEALSSNIGVEEMETVYASKFAAIRGPGRKYYDARMAAAPGGVCPLCGVQIVSTLDHYLPKSKYPALAVTPSNLIPSCYDCNFGKGRTNPSTEEEVPLNPYFDNCDEEVWLKVQFSLVDREFIPNYIVVKPDQWTNLLFHRTQFHVKLYNLQKLYAVHAVDEISNCKFRWKNVLQNCGIKGLQNYLIEDCQSRENVSLNSWQSALYRGLVENIDLLNSWLTA